MYGDAYSVKSVWQRSPAHTSQARCSFSFKKGAREAHPNCQHRSDSSSRRLVR